MNNNNKVLDVSWGTILKVSLTFLCFDVVFLVRDILVWCIFALIISILFNPAIAFLQRLRIPRVISIIFVYTVIFGIIALFIYWTAQMFISEIQ
jgi:predicted PurR-regulated permease PerM